MPIGGTSKIRVQCDVCAVELWKWPSQISRSKRSFCGRSCVAKARRTGFDMAAWRAANKALLLEIATRWRKQNAEKRRQIQAKYRATHKAEIAAWHAIRKSAKARTRPIRLIKLLKSVEGFCVYCGRRTGRLELDHIVPVARGGTGAFKNFMPACRACNSSKSDKECTDWLFEKHGVAGLGRAIYFIENGIVHPGLRETAEV